MSNQNILKKKLKKILLTIYRLIGSFFDKFKSSNKHTPIKKKFNILDNKIENFFDKFRSLKKYNLSKNKFYYLTIPMKYYKYILILCQLIIYIFEFH